jgi:hypothetical protein
MELPRREVLWQLLSTMGPLSITYICKNVSYLFIQTTAATLETTKLAAHQALFAVWNVSGTGACRLAFQKRGTALGLSDLRTALGPPPRHTVPQLLTLRAPAAAVGFVRASC